MKQLLVYKVWQRTLFTWVGITAFFVGLHRGVDWKLLLAAYLMNQWFMFTLSVGNHRLFSHGAFETSQFWRWAFAITSVVSGNGSAYTWTFIHRGHHRYSDTPKDPYETNWHYFFRHKHKLIEYDIPKTKWMLKDPAHYYTHKYCLLWMAAFGALCYYISLDVLIWAYLVPAAWHHLTGGLLIIFTHDKNGPCDRPWYWGILLPAAGEWYHRSHHEAGQARRLNNAQLPWQWDSGYWFARLISK